MFKIKNKAHGLIEIKGKGIDVVFLRVPTDREYPETKEEFKKVMLSSYYNIANEIRYMAGCVYFTKAPNLRPKTKSWWFKKVFFLVEPLNEIIAAFGIKPDKNHIEV